MAKLQVVGYEVDLKWVSLCLLIVQNTVLVLAMRYSRVNAEVPYLTSTAVMMAELMKLGVSAAMVYRERLESNDFSGYVLSEIMNVDTLKLSVPGLLYTIQNNLLFIALSNLDAAVYQVTYQLKILTTAVFSVTMLNKTLNSYQIIALIVLSAGVACVQLATQSGSGSTIGEQGNAFLGLVCVLLACMSSGFAGVYTEKILKTGRPVSLFTRNIQLGLFGTVLGLVGVLGQDFSTVVENGFFQGYNWLVVFVVFTQAAGGLMIAVVMKYADNILKGFATSISIILSAYLSTLILQFSMSGQFMFGASLVIAAVFLYGYTPGPVQPIV